MRLKSSFSFLKHSNCHWHNWYFYLVYENNIRRRFSSLVPSTVYDFGSGDGHYRSIVSSYGHTYIGVDWGNSAHGGVPDIKADLNQPLPITDDEIDVVLCWSVLEHLPEPDSFLAEVHRALKPGGVVFLQVPFMWQIHEGPYDYYRYTKFGLAHLFSKAGFHDVSINPQSGIFVTLVMKILYQIRRVIGNKNYFGLANILYLLSVPAYSIAHLLDKKSRSEGETSGYIVTAIKP